MSSRLRRSTSPIAASDFTELAFLFLAHVPLEGAASLWSPALQSWAAGWIDEGDRELLMADASLVATGDPHVLQAWPELFVDLTHQAPTHTRALAELGPEDVASLAALRALAPHQLEGELVHAQLSLLAEGFLPVHRAELSPALASQLPLVGRALEELSGFVPELAHVRVELSWCLGGHGRGFADRIVVGAPAAWNDLDPMTSAIWALHEHLVQRGPEDYVEAEWSALTGGVAALRGARAPLRAAHAGWLSSLELTGLSAALVQRGVLGRAEADAFLADPAATLLDRAG